MIEHDEFERTPADDVLDKHLLALKRFAPSAAFQDRVLARVPLRAVTAPVPVRRRARALATPRRLWWVSGLAAAGSTAWTIGIANWLSTANLQAAVAWLNTQVGGPLQAAALHGAALAGKAALYYGNAIYSSVGNGVFPIAAAAMIAPVLSGWGLYLTMKQHSIQRIPAHAVR
jgi:hypothetical protein